MSEATAPLDQSSPPRENEMDQGLTLIHFGDLHLWSLGLDGDLFPKRLLGLANLALRRGRRFPRSLAMDLLARIAGETADYVLFSGDLTTTSLRREFEDGRALFRPLVDRWGERFIAIPGNHDRYTPRAVRQGLWERLFTPTARSSADPFALDLDSHWTLVGADVSTPRLLTARGRATSASIEAIGGLLAREQARGRHRILMTHYPLIYPEGMSETWDHRLDQRDRLLAVVKKTGVRLHLHGHMHRRWHAYEDGLTALNCGSAGQTGHRLEKSPGYLKIRLAPDGAITVEAVWLNPNGHGPGRPGWTVSPLPARPAA